jgi:glycosyltransferase involved in cell wall biosynthesis
MNPDAGGAEVFTHEVAKRLVARGWSVTLFTSMFQGAEKEQDLDGVEIVRRGGRFGVYSKAKDYCRKFSSDSDVIVDEINTRPFMTPKYVRTRPIIALIHQLAREYWFYETPWPLSWIGYYYLEKAWLNHYRHVKTITVSQSTKTDLVDWGFNDVHVVPQGLSVEVVSGIPEKAERPTLLFVGRLKRAKKPDHAIRAFRMVRDRIPHAKLWVVGEGYLRRRLERMASEGVEFTGRVEQAVKVRLMTEAHVLLFPAVREGWGLSITEANARGSPAIAYDVPGVRDAIKNNKTGILVAPDDYVAMANGAIKLLEDSALMRTLSSEAITWAKNFSWDTTALAFAGILSATAQLTT